MYTNSDQNLHSTVHTLSHVFHCEPARTPQGEQENTEIFVPVLQPTVLKSETQ